MRVIWIIPLLLGFIGVEKNLVDSSISLVTPLTCEKTSLKWIFVLSPEAKEINVLTELVKSARSAVVERSKNKDGEVRMYVGPEDYQMFKKQTELLKVYKSHSWQCNDESITIFPSNSNKSTIPTRILNSRNVLFDFITSSSPIRSKKFIEDSTRIPISYPDVKFDESRSESKNFIDKTWPMTSFSASGDLPAYFTSGVLKRPKSINRRGNEINKTFESRSGSLDNSERERSMINWEKDNLNDGKNDEDSVMKKMNIYRTDETKSHVADTKRTWLKLTSKMLNSMTRIPLTKTLRAEIRRFINNRRRKINTRFQDRKNLTNHLSEERNESAEMRNKRMLAMTNSPRSRSLKSTRESVKTTRRFEGLDESQTTKTFKKILDSSVATSFKDSTNKPRDKRSNIKIFGLYEMPGFPRIRIINRCDNVPNSPIEESPQYSTSTTVQTPKSEVYTVETTEEFDLDKNYGNYEDKTTTNVPFTTTTEENVSIHGKESTDTPVSSTVNNEGNEDNETFDNYGDADDYKDDEYTDENYDKDED